MAGLGWDFYRSLMDLTWLHTKDILIQKRLEKKMLLIMWERLIGRIILILYFCRGCLATAYVIF